MTKANECTCPSGDGSLRHPCPAHPASVELAGVGAKLTFINGRPAMCGCQVEYSSGGGEYSDVIYVTLCAKHSGSAILDLVATNRIALTPEYEGQWHADLYLDREIPLAKAEGATPAEAVLALMSAERIDPEQGGVDQAGGDRWDALQSIMEWTAAENIPDDRKLCLIRNAARAALAQPSPAQADEKPGDSILCYGCFAKGVGPEHFDEAGKCLVRQQTEPLGAEFSQVLSDNLPELLSTAQAEQAEAERPEVVAWRYGFSGGIVSDKACLDEWKSGGEYQSLMTVAQHERIVGELRAVIAQLRQHKNDYMDAGQETYRALQNEIREREAEIARLDGLVSGRTAERDAALARVAELERGKVYVEARQCDECQHGGINDSATGVAACHECDWTGPEPEEDRCPGCQRENCMAAACPQCGARYVLVASEEIAAPVAQAQQLNDLDKQCRDDVARALGLRPSQERGFAWSYLLASIKSCVEASEDAAQAQHSVPEGYALIPTRETEAMHDAVMALLYKGVARTDTQKLLNAYIAAAPGKEGV
ncbi:hypothetical protein [Pseudomonas aeruginosa]|uniref:hypothetical protein n=1 Tax=Pseudomonas aeruginosa TaxID=287 RepID=UPI0029033B4C|nr:hypothetical protein [Pseudomonas aeruginosa]MDU0693817.1 hypothetical protein [Pseudomonas aeruginosa]